MANSPSNQHVQLAESTNKLVYLVTTDPHLVAYLSQQLIHFGYYIQHTRDLKSLANVMADHHAVAILVDTSSSDLVGGSGGNIFEEISDLPKTSSPLVFISDSDDQDLRLRSIQVGGTAFFTKPINIVGLIDKLDLLNSLANFVPKPYRVLIVENQLSIASYYKMVLEMAGMEVRFELNTNNVLNQVREYHPDLVLMDTFLPKIKGTDLAKIIRQIDEFVSLPIIFLSSEDDFAKRIEALDLGGDDFLIKPIKAAHLVAVTRSRLERLKTLRSYMVRDSLTNLLNHTTFRSVLTQEINRSKRQNLTMALAMMDLDHFKLVNDSFGHAAGDSVIKSMSRLLRQRLRKSDIIGRYGGEEFVALLLDCDAEQAKMIMDDIRIHFSKIEFTPKETQKLSVTFSCGISTFPEFNSAQDLSDAADQALYAAKANGRNQVIIARPSLVS
jgi:diguanylate cyclase (GGDEF)-like protein